MLLAMVLPLFGDFSCLSHTGGVGGASVSVECTVAYEHASLAYPQPLMKRAGTYPD